MSKFNPLYTILVTVIEGRYFTQNQNSKLYVECRFIDDTLSLISSDSNYILSTDTVEQTSSPIWNTELAWEVDHKTLLILRSQWAHLKLQCFSVNSPDRSELVGYSMLDLRTASERPGKEKWISLHNPRVRGLRPEINIGFCILPNMSPPSTPTPLGYVPSPLGKSVENLFGDDQDDVKNTINNAEEKKYDDDDLYRIGTDGSEIFLFAITINFGANLHLLLQDTISFITQQQFPEVDEPDLSTHGYFFQYTIFESTIISTKFYDLTHPNIIPETATFRILSSLKDMKDFLEKESNLVINLYHDDQIIGFSDIPLKGLFDLKTGEPRSLDRVCPIYNTKRELPVSADVQIARIGIYLTLKRENTETLIENESLTSSPIAIEKPQSIPSENVDQALTREQNSEHKYSILIVLESIKLNKDIKNIFIIYSYPALGISNKSTQVIPNVEAGSDVLLVNGTSTIDVTMTHQKLKRYFEAVPLLMEIWQNNEPTDVQIGVATLRLEEVFLSLPTIDEESKAEVQTFTTLTPIKSVGLVTSREMGHISVSIRLEDYGEKQKTILANSNSGTNLSELSSGSPVPEEPQPMERQSSSRSSTSLSGTKNECERFSLSLSTFRSDIFQQAEENLKFTREVLADEKKNAKNQSSLKSKVQQLKSIDRQLQQSILYFQTRDESLLRAEKDFERRWLELDRQFEQRKKEMQSQLQANTQNLQAEIQNLKIQLDSATKAQKHYEAQWLKALQVLAGTHETESEEAMFWKELKETDLCWWQVKRTAEEEIEVINYEKFALDILKGEIERLRKSSSN
ncbi:15065_t:CDS:2 [Dentiscutata heterogama]|uniref:15065_t:CDS:1 n=1 Tax=Dentiscutata heterogama TaxID=1316150 RepID=A0ACA9NFA4_9GLOM|nr:15065_t:CDS:2 [Dentiscutata heterogama]